MFVIIVILALLLETVRRSETDCNEATIAKPLPPLDIQTPTSVFVSDNKISQKLLFVTMLIKRQRCLSAPGTSDLVVPSTLIVNSNRLVMKKLSTVTRKEIHNQRTNQINYTFKNNRFMSQSKQGYRLHKLPSRPSHTPKSIDETTVISQKWERTHSYLEIHMLSNKISVISKPNKIFSKSKPTCTRVMSTLEELAGFPSLKRRETEDTNQITKKSKSQYNNQEEQQQSDEHRDIITDINMEIDKNKEVDITEDEFREVITTNIGLIGRRMNKDSDTTEAIKWRNKILTGLKKFEDDRINIQKKALIIKELKLLEKMTKKTPQINTPINNNNEKYIYFEIEENTKIEDIDFTKAKREYNEKTKDLNYNKTEIEFVRGYIAEKISIKSDKIFYNTISIDLAKGRGSLFIGKASITEINRTERAMNYDQGRYQFKVTEKPKEIEEIKKGEVLFLNNIPPTANLEDIATRFIKEYFKQLLGEQPAFSSLKEGKEKIHIERNATVETNATVWIHPAIHDMNIIMKGSAFNWDQSIVNITTSWKTEESLKKQCFAAYMKTEENLTVSQILHLVKKEGLNHNYFKNYPNKKIEISLIDKIKEGSNGVDFKSAIIYFKNEEEKREMVKLFAYKERKPNARFYLEEKREKQVNIDEKNYNTYSDRITIIHSSLQVKDQTQVPIKSQPPGTGSKDNNNQERYSVQLGLDFNCIILTYKWIQLMNNKYFTSPHKRRKSINQILHESRNQHPHGLGPIISQV